MRLCKFFSSIFQKTLYNRSMKKKTTSLSSLLMRAKRFISSLLWLEPCAGGMCIRKRGDKKELLCISHREGRLMLPKWKCKIQETLQEAAKREFREETGIFDFQLGEILWVVRDRKRRKKTTFFTILKPGKQNPHIHDESVLWVEINQAIKEMRHKEEKKLLQKYVKNTLGKGN